MRQIFKYRVDDVPAKIYGEPVFLHAATIDGVRYVWSETNAKYPGHNWRLASVGTGWDFEKAGVPSEARHAGTIIEGHFVWHIYAWRL